MIDLKKICIRAKNPKGEWDSLSLDELIDMHVNEDDPLNPKRRKPFDGIGQVLSWIRFKYLKHIGYGDEGVGIGKEAIAIMVEDLEKLGVPIVKYKVKLGSP